MTDDPGPPDDDVDTFLALLVAAKDARSEWLSAVAWVRELERDRSAGDEGQLLAALSRCGHRRRDYDEARKALTPYVGLWTATT